MIAKWRISVLKTSLRNAWPAFLTLGGPVLAWVLILVLGTSIKLTTSKHVLYAGMTLELFGICLVAYDLNETLKKFGRPSWTRKVWEWCKFLCTAIMPQTHVFGTANLRSESTVTFSDGAVHQLGEDATPEARISALEKNLDILRDETNQRFHAATRELSSQKTSIDGLNLRMGEIARTTNVSIEDLAVGGANLEMIGLFWVAIGVFATNIPESIAGWFGFT